MYEKSCEISKNVYKILVTCILKISNINVYVYCVPIIQQISDNRYFSDNVKQIFMKRIVLKSFY